MVSLNVPSSNGVSLGLCGNEVNHKLKIENYILIATHPNITAFHNIILLSVGAALTPGGGSSCSL
jgi:hypothetical protein